MITLVLEASTYAGSVAVLDGDALLGEREVVMRGREREALLPATADLLTELALVPKRVQRIVCGSGPGAFTSLRVAAAIAKGIALSSGAELIPVSSLALVVASRVNRRAAHILAVIDAMRNESYVQLYADDGETIIARGLPEIVHTSDVDGKAAGHGAEVIGPQCAGGGYSGPRAASARYLTKLIEGTARADLAGWAPAYGRLAEAQVKWEALHGRALTNN